MARNNFARVIIYVGYLRFISLRFLLCEEIIQEAAQRETIDTAALRLFLCGLIQAECYSSGSPQFQLHFSHLGSSYFSFLWFYEYVRLLNDCSTTLATWLDSTYFSASLKGKPHFNFWSRKQVSLFKSHRIPTRRRKHLSCATFALFKCHHSTVSRCLLMHSSHVSAVGVRPRINGISSLFGRWLSWVKKNSFLKFSRRDAELKWWIQTGAHNYGRQEIGCSVNLWQCENGHVAP